MPFIALVKWTPQACGSFVPASASPFPCASRLHCDPVEIIYSGSILMINYWLRKGLVHKSIYHLSSVGESVSKHLGKGYLVAERIQILSFLVCKWRLKLSIRGASQCQLKRAQMKRSCVLSDKPWSHLLPCSSICESIPQSHILFLLLVVVCICLH